MEVSIVWIISMSILLLISSAFGAFLYKRASQSTQDIATKQQQEQVDQLLEQQDQLTEQHNKLNQQYEQMSVELRQVTGEKHELEVERSAREQALRQQVSLLAEKSEGLDRLREEQKQLQESLAASQSECARLQSLIEERQHSREQQKRDSEEQKTVFAKEFENLANRIFAEKGKRFAESSQTSLQTILNPFKEQLEGFHRRVNQVHTESVQGNAKLEEQIKQVMDMGIKLSEDATHLSTALRGDKKAQGNWSEVQAELLLEMSGLQKDREYQREANYKTEEGRDQRPDFIINLPNGKHIIVDSKISLNHYISAVAAETDEQFTLCMRHQVEAIRKHVKTLSDKDYPRLKGLESAEFVFMFIGNEAAYLATASSEPNLFQEAYQKGVAIVTPNTLLSSLRIVAHLWSIDKQNRNTVELAEQASKIHDKLRIFVEKMERLGSQIKTVQNSFDDSLKTLHSGRGSLYRQVDRFVELGITVKERLPQRYIDDELEGTEEVSAGLEQAVESPVE